MNGRDLLDAMEYISDDLIEEAAAVREHVQGNTKTLRWFRPAKWTAMAAGAAFLCVSALTWNEWQQAKRANEEITEYNTDTSDTAPLGGDAENGVVSAEEAAIDTAAAEDSVSGETGIARYTDESNTQQKQDAANQLTEGNAGSNAERIPEYIVDDFSTEAEICYRAPEKGACIYSIPLKDAFAYYEDGTWDGNVESDNANAAILLYHVTIDVFGGRETGGESAYNELRLNEDGQKLLMEEYERLRERGYNVSLSEDFLLTGLLTKTELETFDASPDYGYMFFLISETH